MNSNEIIISPQQRAQIEALEYIGAGACANVYKDNDTVYKIIKENAKPLYWPGSLEKLSEVKSNLCVFPNEVLKDSNGAYIGYTMDFVPGQKMGDVFQDLSFDQLQHAISEAEIGVNELSESKISFDDMHFNNIMWNSRDNSIKIIDTDFYKFADEIPTEELRKINRTKFNNQFETLMGIRDGTLAKYLNRNTEYTQYYKEWFKRTLSGEELNPYELIDKIKSIAEKDFGIEFNSISEILQRAQDKVNEYEDQELNIEEWSEGNESLRNLLISCRDNNVPSMYSCAGHNHGKHAYLTVQMNDDTIGKIYNIMSQLSGTKKIEFRFAQDEFGKNPSFTVHINDDKHKNEIMDTISNALTHEQNRDVLPEDFKKLTNIKDILTENNIGFDLLYNVGKHYNRISLEHLKFANSTYLEKSDFKEMGLNPKEDMFGNTLYARSRLSKEKSIRALDSLLQGLSQAYSKDYIPPEKLSLRQRIAQRITSNKFLNRLPFIDKIANNQKLLPPAQNQVHLSNQEREAFINELSHNGDYRNLPTISLDSVTQSKETLDKNQAGKNADDDLSL